MKKIKVLTVFGTRPEAIKMAPVIKLMEENLQIDSKICVTAQHREMLDQVIEVFNLKPDYDLNIMTNNQTLADITTSTIKGVENVIKVSKPDIVLVHGDTTTTFAASLVSFYSKIKVGHVEAGLRTNKKFEPFPEEVNRKLTGSIADLHFAPTMLAKQNLIKENISKENIFVTGNTAVDCLKLTIKDSYTFNYNYLNKLDYKNKKIIVVTAHRRENIGKPLENICNAILKLVKNNENVEVVYSVHFNPSVRKIVNKILGNSDKIHLVDPLDINDMHNLINLSYFVMTDSGGLQEEVPSLKKPVLVLRNVTERPEGVKSGTLKLTGTEVDNIYLLAQKLIDDESIYKNMANSRNPFGDGNASLRIIDSILFEFGVLNERPQEFNL